jgi:hypothetical protein
MPFQNPPVIPFGLTRARIILALAFALALPVWPKPGTAQAALDGFFTARFEGDRVHLSLQVERDWRSGRTGRSSYGRTLERSALSAFDRSADGVQFTLQREAGRFVFRGRGSQSRVSGTFEFTPNPSFQQELSRLGFADLEPNNLYIFALEDVTVSGVRQLQTQVSDELTTAQLVRMINHGAGPRFVREMNDLSFRRLASSEYVRARDHGVSPDFVRGMREAGIRLSLNELIRSRDHGVGPEFVQDMRELGLDLTHDEMVHARDHGVSPEFVRDMRALGHRDSHQQIVRARDHGVSPQYIREFHELGYDNLPLSDYVRFRDHGVSADFVRGLSDLGYKSLTPGQLVRLRDHGVTVSYVRGILGQFREAPSVEQLVRLRSSGYSG